jgi:Holin of 3TMs, for gene-transfer release
VATSTSWAAMPKVHPYSLNGDPMPIPLVGLLAPVLGTVIDRLIPDRAEAERAKREIEAKLAEAETAGQLAQIEVNKTEAQHRSIFVAGWRPALGWLGVACLAYSLIAYNLLCWLLVLAGIDATPPSPPDIGSLMTVVMGMLGLGTLRTYEKKSGLTK